MIKPHKILVVDDEIHILELIKYNLESKGFLAITCENGEDAVNLVKEHKDIDLMVLDLMLPGINGLEVCKQIRESQYAKLPIIMLTAKGEENNKIQGLDVGADDYMTKPFSVGELMARIKAVLRRSDDKVIESKLIEAMNIVIDIEKHEAYNGDEKLELTLKEFQLLKLLIKNRGKVLSRDIILDTIWGYEYFGDTRTVDVHIRHLRKKINDNKGKLIETVRGVGYKMK